MDTLQKLVWILKSVLHTAATPLTLGMAKEGNIHRQVPCGEGLEVIEREDSLS